MSLVSKFQVNNHYVHMKFDVVKETYTVSDKLSLSGDVIKGEKM